jgi:hypothetical protein
LAGADVYFQPSSAVESFGIAFIEAMHAGLPIVTYAIGGPAEFVTGEVGFAAANSTEIVSGLRALISSPELRVKLGRNAQHKARSLCEPTQQLPGLAHIIERGLRVGLRSSSSAANVETKPDRRAAPPRLPFGD